jgi:hypothetical protein
MKIHLSAVSGALQCNAWLRALRPIIAIFAAAGLVATVTIVTTLATASSGLTATPIARTTIPQEFKIHAMTDQIDVKMESKGPVDVVVNNNKLAPGGTVGWHSHTGPVVVQIRKGMMTLYDGSDPNCTPQDISAGEAFVENVTEAINGRQHVHTVRNEGIVDLEWTAASFVPVGEPGRIDQPAPGNCPF